MRNGEIVRVAEEEVAADLAAEREEKTAANAEVRAAAAIVRVRNMIRDRSMCAAWRAWLPADGASHSQLQ